VNAPEFIPITGGLLVGLFLGRLHPSLRLRTGALLILAFGLLATWTSGEFQISWAFLVADIPLVAVSAAAGLAGLHVFQKSRGNVENRHGTMGP
jgi:hypothetical protein